jgi:hypothetical protein
MFHSVDRFLGIDDPGDRSALVQFCSVCSCCQVFLTPKALANFSPRVGAPATTLGDVAQKRLLINPERVNAAQSKRFQRLFMVFSNW